MIGRLVDWWSPKANVLCLTGAGLSTASGIPDYRGSQGSYHRGHQPMVHDQFINSPAQRQRYWGRSLVGWTTLAQARPNAGHVALAQLEGLGRLGVDVPASTAYEDPAEDDEASSALCKHNHSRRLALVTQNVDTLHRRAGSRNLVELHGRLDRLRCMGCGSMRDRHSFHDELAALNADWLEAARAATDETALRPDGDAAVATDNFAEISIPPCTHCGGFMKPDVVFFGDVRMAPTSSCDYYNDNLRFLILDLCASPPLLLLPSHARTQFTQSVPKHRVALIQAAMAQADGLLVAGSSLTVHSAYRHVRAACQQGIPVAILNVGETRPEVEGLDVFKLEAPASATLAGVLAAFQDTMPTESPSDPAASVL
jgi:NAD-dependent deacetylase sirtuin 4